jgi:2-oxoglutarate dehydrogenase E2 component (dihydrolipoamide succinyltransferase)
MPQMGESIAEGTVTKWFKKVGDRVERDEPLLEISTDKVDTEIPAPSSGVVSEIKVQEGETVAINTVIAVIGGEVKPPAAAASPSETMPPKAAPVPPPSPPPTPPPTPEAPTPSPARPAPPTETSSTQAGLRSSPLVRKIAREHDLDISRVTGTGRGGRVTKDDVLKLVDAPRPGPRSTPPASPSPSLAAPTPAPVAPKAAPRPSPAPAPPPPPPAAPSPASPGPSPAGRVTIEPMSKIRKSVAAHMVLSRQTSAHVTTVFEVDVSRIVELRADNKFVFEQEGVKLTYTPFFVAATLGSLKAFPLLNASIDGDSVVYHRDHNIGLAVALDGGLIVPVIHNADEKSFLGLTRAVNDLGERARTKKLLPADVQGGTFTITNPGSFGGLFGTPIINQPQVAILAVGGIHKRPVVVGDGIGVRSMVYLALSFDHRLIDGALADQFMADLKGRLENWDHELL